MEMHFDLEIPEGATLAETMQRMAKTIEATIATCIADSEPLSVPEPPPKIRFRTMFP